ncbi:MAG: hypothetical protein DWQ34_21110 [Planctomycetota bacterium]|nr:MAG: hypothetical protein DWQ34_21110 [Planctomycetota bacterium]REJ93577.1 MAG: hypothetical protein DWQ29_03620 [Planctomycetota bacterium]REK20443.1 MAG: hypothetical protein DWQ41_25250 [Planctomycetota bacterium]REK29264.1 MAG: hypothetical protein DWQ45_23110 [Planctomycetota bacterium]
MSVEDEPTPAADEQRAGDLRQLEHDIKSYLNVVSMGLFALEGVKDEPDKVADLCKTIEEDGVKPLKGIVAEIVALARNAQK